MNFPLFVGYRYLKAKKSHNVINIISWISIVGICITTTALVIVLSVFNGFEDLVSSLFTSFEPDLNITIKKGKTFKNDEIDISRLRLLPGVSSITEVVEDNALIKNDQQQVIATVKGVSDDYSVDNHLQEMIIYGSKKSLENNMGIIGFGVGYYVGLEMYDLPKPLTIMIPRRTASNLLNPINAFNSSTIFINGVYSVQQELDNKYVIIPIKLARSLLEYTNEVTSIEIRLNNKDNIKKMQSTIQAIVGQNYVVENHYEMQSSLYKVMHSEKAAIYIILSFILLIATFNLIGTLSMLIIDKEKDITILWSMGADKKMIKKIYYYESLMMTTIGAVLGILLGTVVCVIQIYSEVIKFAPDSSFVIDAYPVRLLFSDLMIVFVTVIVIGALTSLIPISRLRVGQRG